MREVSLRTPTSEIARSEQLGSIVRMLAEAPEVRDELADDIRSQIAQGSYLSDEKLELAIYRMLKDLLH